MKANDTVTMQLVLAPTSHDGTRRTLSPKLAQLRSWVRVSLLALILVVVTVLASVSLNPGRGVGHPSGIGSLTCALNPELSLVFLPNAYGNLNVMDFFNSGTGEFAVRLPSGGSLMGLSSDARDPYWAMSLFNQDLIPRALIGNDDYTETMFTCLQDFGAILLSAWGPADPPNPNNFFAYTRANEVWADCAQANLWPETVDHLAPVGYGSVWPVVTLPATISTADLTRLLTVCPFQSQDPTGLWQGTKTPLKATFLFMENYLPAPTIIFDTPDQLVPDPLRTGDELASYWTQHEVDLHRILDQAAMTYYAGVVGSV